MKKDKTNNNKIKLGNKALTLLALESRVSSAKTLPLLAFEVSDWVLRKDEVITSIQNKFSNSLVIIRSAAATEDSESESNAGHFLSVPNVNTENFNQLEKSINSVIESYKKVVGKHLFFVQEQLKDIKICGVIFTSDIDTLSPYYTVNYDLSESNEVITSGGRGDIKTYVKAKYSNEKPLTSEMEKAISLAKELEELTENEHLDIEFAIDKNENIYLLQVRPIVISNKSSFIYRNRHLEYLNKIKLKIEKINNRHPSLLGDTGVLSVMTDWNPAEMIGIRPKKLALSLYKELITDSVWAYQRDNYGYRNLRSFPLLISLIEQPYIDVRVSFNSFIPKTISDNLAEKLVNYYTKLLTDSPTDHDKIEFNIVFSCYFLGINKKIKKLKKFGFSELEIDRIKFSLIKLTNKIVDPVNGLYLKDLEKLEILKTKSEEILESDLSTLDKIYWLVENCKRYGTLPFSGLARAGFISVQFLQSMVSEKIITELEKDAFLGSINTIGKQLASDTEKLRNKTLEKSKFLKKYGHLRPGTYDVMSKSYKEGFDEYFSNSLNKNLFEVENENTFNFSEYQIKAINTKLIDHGLDINSSQLITFIKKSIEGREYGKFIFTKIVSQLLELTQKVGERFSLTREDISWVNIDTILDLHSSLTIENVGEILKADIRKNKLFHEASKQIRLPQVIQSPEDIYNFFLSDVEPNYVTQKRITEIIITEDKIINSSLENKIVFIEKADPGYDWIFSKKIAGLITMYGGANSHMAIRCSELSIPAVIGCGEENYFEWSKAEKIEIDCANKQVKLLK